MTKLITHLIFLGFTLKSAAVFAVELELKWSLEDVFEMPESAVYDAVRNAIYVST